jgi:DNA-binding winged helix-turn-helix (wHTH) protein
LTASEFDLLKVFAENPNRPLQRDWLLEVTAHREMEAFDRAIDLRITRLRRKIEPDPAHPDVIRTVRGIGYMFKALVALWEAYPTHASHEGTFEFRDDGSRSLFEAVAVMTGLSPLVRELEARLAADVE